MKEIGASLVSWIIGLVASGEAAILIRKMVEAAKARAGAQGISEDGHKTTHDYEAQDSAYHPEDYQPDEDEKEALAALRGRSYITLTLDE